MLNRKELKAKGKIAFQNNYWACVIVSVLLSLTVSSVSSVNFETNFSYVGGVEQTTTHLTLYGIPLMGNLAINAVSGSLIVLLVTVFLTSVIEVGGCSFFGKNAYEIADLKELFFGFNKICYKNIVIVQFVRKAKVFLWGLLFIIPGIVKSYEYYMIPYILADNPNMPHDEAFALSKKMMYGHKMDVFIFDLSFFLWELLAVFTFGILSIFYVNPYIYASRAEIYHNLKFVSTQSYENMNESSQ